MANASTVLPASCGVWLQVLDEGSCSVGSAAQTNAGVTNDPPTMPGIAITPERPSTCRDLVCEVTQGSVDPDGDDLTYRARWYVDGVRYQGPLTTTHRVNDTIPASELIDGAAYRCHVAAEDGLTMSDYAEARAVVRNGFAGQDYDVSVFSGNEVDVLFVVDNSPSMAEEHVLLTDAVTALASRFDADNVDYHIGVTTTDITNVPGGELELFAGRRWVEPATPNLDLTLEGLISVGADGFYVERGVAAAWLALTRNNRSGVNDGFRRNNANLALIFVSDEDDHSFEPLTPRLIAAGRAVEDRNDVDVSAHALVGPDPSGCSAVGTDATAAPTYTSVVDSLNGEVGSICDADYGPFLDDVARASQLARRSYAIPDSDIDVSQLWVRLNGVVLDPAEWDYDPIHHAVVLAEAPVRGDRVDVRYLATCN